MLINHCGSIQMSSKDRMFAEPYRPDQSPQRGQEIINLSLEDLDELKRSVDEKFSALYQEMLDIRGEIDKLGQESSRLEQGLNGEFKLIEDLIAPDRQMRFHLGHIEMADLTVHQSIDSQVRSPGLQGKNFEYLCELDQKNFEEEEGMTSCDGPANKLKETIDELYAISNDGFDSIFQRLSEIKEDSKQRKEDLDEMRSCLESKCLQIRDLIKTILPREELDSIVKVLVEVETKFQSTFQGMDSAIGGIHGQLNKDNGRYSELVDDIFSKFKRLEERIINEEEMRKSRWNNEL